MFLGIVLLFVAILTVGVLMMVVPGGALEPPHGEGCDCKECSLYLVTKQLREAKRKGRRP